MDFCERQFEDLSDLQYRVFTSTPGSEYGDAVLVLEFSGVFGHGSGGHGGGVYMRAITLAAIASWVHDAVIFDLRGLDYEWGNDIWDVFGGPSIPPFTVEHPQALVVSDRCRRGFSTCTDMIPKMFDDLESAVAFVKHAELDRKVKLDRQLCEERDGQQSVPARSLCDRLRSLFSGR